MSFAKILYVQAMSENLFRLRRFKNEYFCCGSISVIITNRLVVSLVQK